MFEHVISPVTSRILSLLNSHDETELATTSENNLSEEDEDIQSTMQILNVYYANKTLCQIILQNREHPAVCSFFDKLTQYMDRQTQLLLPQMFGSTPKKGIACLGCRYDSLVFTCADGLRPLYYLT